MSLQPKFPRVVRVSDLCMAQIQQCVALKNASQSPSSLPPWTPSDVVHLAVHEWLSELTERLGGDTAALLIHPADQPGGAA